MVDNVVIFKYAFKLEKKPFRVFIIFAYEKIYIA